MTPLVLEALTCFAGFHTRTEGVCTAAGYCACSAQTCSAAVGKSASLCGLGVDCELARSNAKDELVVKEQDVSPAPACTPAQHPPNNAARRSSGA